MHIRGRKTHYFCPKTIKFSHLTTLYTMIIAVDFDGTIVEHRYPEIGKEIPFAVATLKELQKDGHKLILWTVREGEYLEAAVKWCEERGLRFIAVNQNLDENGPGESLETNSSYSRKLKAHLFIDDRNIGGLLDWGVVYELVSKRMNYEQYLISQGDNPPTLNRQKEKKPWWKF